MEIIDGNWIMNGRDWDDEGCIRSAEGLLEVIENVGFLPLFGNEIDGFSVESLTEPSCWWSGDEALDPWEWRVALSPGDKVVYGKFFGNKAGFISKKWFPYFANFRRQGYDFDSRYEDGKADYREKLLMDLFIPENTDIWDIKPQSLSRQGRSRELFTNEMKEKAGFGKGGHKNFEGTLSKLQMQSYLVVKEFRQRINKQGEPFGWAVANMTLPEYKWGYKHVTSRYKETPEMSLDAIIDHLMKVFDGADEKTIRKILR